jgi:hypothetical protein
VATEASILGEPVSACADTVLRANSVAARANLMEVIIKILLIKCIKNK